MRHPEPKRLSANLRVLAGALEKRGELALRLAKDHQAENQGQGPGPKNGISDPTGEAGARGNPDRHVHDNLVFLLRQLHENAADTVAMLVAICANFDDQGKPVKPMFKKERLTPSCQFCEDDATKRGCCNACYQYKWDRCQRTGQSWAEVTVPRHVIQDRDANREKKRLRLNPLTGEESVA